MVKDPRHHIGGQTNNRLQRAVLGQGRDKQLLAPDFEPLFHFAIGQAALAAAVATPPHSPCPSPLLPPPRSAPSAPSSPSPEGGG